MAPDVIEKREKSLWSDIEEHAERIALLVNIYLSGSLGTRESRERNWPSVFGFIDSEIKLVFGYGGSLLRVYVKSIKGSGAEKATNGENQIEGVEICCRYKRGK